MRCNACQGQWRGVVPLIGLLSIIGCVAVVSYQVGRHLSPPARIDKVTERTQVIVVEPSYRPAEPNHQGKR